MSEIHTDAINLLKLENQALSCDIGHLEGWYLLICVHLPYNSALNHLIHIILNSYFYDMISVIIKDYF